jgi:hypothetical protein
MEKHVRIPVLAKRMRAEVLTAEVENDISVKERSDRTGTVMFGRPHPYARWHAGMQWPGMGQYQPPSFELIQDAKRVHDQMLEAQRVVA